MLKKYRGLLIILVIFTALMATVSTILLLQQKGELDRNVEELTDTITDEIRITSDHVYDSLVHILGIQGSIIRDEGINVTSRMFDRLSNSANYQFLGAIQNFRYTPIIYNDERESHQSFGKSNISPAYKIRPVTGFETDEYFLSRPFYMPIDGVSPDIFNGALYGLDLYNLTSTVEAFNLFTTPGQIIFSDGISFGNSRDEFDLGVYIGTLITVENCSFVSRDNFFDMILANKDNGCIIGTSYVAALIREIFEAAISFYNTGLNREVFSSMHFTVFGTRKQEILYKPPEIPSYMHPNDLKEMDDKICKEFTLKVDDTNNLIVTLVFNRDGIEDKNIKDSITMMTIMLVVAYLLVSSIIIVVHNLIRKNLNLKEKQVDELNTLVDYVNHELRNPLNILLAMLDITIKDLKKFMTTEEAEVIDIIRHKLESTISRLEEAYSSNHAITTVINDVLDLQRFERGELEALDISPQVTTLGEVAAMATRSLQHRIDEKKMTIAYESSVEHPDMKLFSDTNRINQILTNFLNNALDHTNEGKISLVIKDEGTTVLMSVIDTGTGVSPELEKQLFVTKYLGDEHARTKGVGIGLYLCRVFAGILGGSVGFSTHFGEGSTFWFRLEKQPIPSEEV